MNERKVPQIVEIDWPFGADAPDLFCPRTGKKVLDAEDYVEQPASPCVTFVFTHEGGLEYIREDLEARLEATRESMVKSGTDEDDLPGDLELLKDHVNLGEVPVLFEITTSGMACGPVHFTIYVGFDLWIEPEEGSNE